MLSLEQKRWQTLWIPGLAITIMLGLLGILAYSALRTTPTSGGKPKEGRQYSGTKTAIATCDYRQTATAKVLGLLTEAGFDAFTPGGSRTDVIAVPTEEAARLSRSSEKRIFQAFTSMIRCLLRGVIGRFLVRHFHEARNLPPRPPLAGSARPAAGVEPKAGCNGRPGLLLLLLRLH